MAWPGPIKLVHLFCINILNRGLTAHISFRRITPANLQQFPASVANTLYSIIGSPSALDKLVQESGQFQKQICSFPCSFSLDGVRFRFKCNTLITNIVRLQHISIQNVLGSYIYW